VLDRRQADLDGEFAAVPAMAVELQAGAHGPQARCAVVALDVMRVSRAQPLGHQHVDRLPDQLVARVVEHPLGLGVDEHDRPRLVDDQDPIGRRVDQLAEREGLGVNCHGGSASDP